MTKTIWVEGNVSDSSRNLTCSIVLTPTLWTHYMSSYLLSSCRFLSFPRWSLRCSFCPGRFVCAIFIIWASRSCSSSWATPGECIYCFVCALYLLYIVLRCCVETLTFLQSCAELQYLVICPAPRKFVDLPNRFLLVNRLIFVILLSNNVPIFAQFVPGHRRPCGLFPHSVGVLRAPSCHGLSAVQPVSSGQNHGETCQQRRHG